MENFDDSLKIYSDGGARGNPGPAACAYVVFHLNKIISKNSEFLGISTNNQAEYRGVLLALKWLSVSMYNRPGLNILFYIDSELVCNQIKHVYRVKDEKLKLLNKEINNYLNSIKCEVKFVAILREKNKIADKLVNLSLDENEQVSHVQTNKNDIL